MIETFVTAFIIYFVVIDPIGNVPLFLAVAEHQPRLRKLRSAIEGTIAATAIMLFFAVCGSWILAYLDISEGAFRIAGGIMLFLLALEMLMLFLLALEMLTARRQQRKLAQSTPDEDDPEADNIAIYPLATPLLAGPSAIMSIIVVNGGFAGDVSSIILSYMALLATMVATALFLSLAVFAESWMNERVTMIFSRVTSIILAGLAVQYVIDGLRTVGLVAAQNV